jgi:large repetitive protein
MYMSGSAVIKNRLAWAKLLGNTAPRLSGSLPVQSALAACISDPTDTPSSISHDPERSDFLQDQFSATARGSRFCLTLLLLLSLFIAAAAPALAVNCSDAPYFGVIDGNFVSAPSQIQIDTNCTIRNFPSPNVLNTNFSFYTQPGGNKERWLVVFDNVVHTGNMSCNATHEHGIWFTNGSSTKIQQGCQNLLIPVEKIDKQNPVGQSTAAIGVPFRYRLTIPVLYDPARGAVINSAGSPNTLHGITVWDDLNATGADLSYVSHVAYWKGAGTAVPHTFSNAGGVLTFEFPSGFIIPAGDQIILDIMVVLRDTPTNVPGKQFVNTAKWEFGRLIEGVFYEPLPGEWGRTAPMTIVGPDLVVTKTGPATLGSTLNLGEWGNFGVEARNVGGGDAWNVSVVDRLPDASSNPPLSGGMCALRPELRPPVQIFAADGSPRTLTAGSDYSLSFSGATDSPPCELTLVLHEAAGPIGPGEYLFFQYRTKLDETTEDGAVLTNVVGATEWFNDRNKTIGQTYTCQLSDGTVGILDCQDAHSVLAAFSGYFFEKTAHDPVTGEHIVSALPGDTLRYRLRIRSIDEAFTALTFRDDLGALNAFPAFAPGSLTLVSTPGGADVTRTDPLGGTNGAGLLDIRNLGVLPGGVVEIVFDATLTTAVPEDAVVSNQAQLIHNGIAIAISNDPTVSGATNAAQSGEADPTRVTIHYPLPAPPLKETLHTAATIGEEVTYTIRVPGSVQPRALYDVEITDPLDPNLEYIGAVVTGVAAASVTNTSTPEALRIAIAEIPAGQQAHIELRARVRNVSGAHQGIDIDNTVSYTYVNSPGAAIRSPLNSETVSIRIVEPFIEEIVKNASTFTPTAGEIVRYNVTMTATGGGDPDAFDVTIIDVLDLGMVYAGNPAVIGPGNTISAPVITGDGVTTPQTLVWSPELGNADIDIAAGTSVTVSYDVRVLDGVLANQPLTNSVVAQWTSLKGPSPFERDGSDGIDGLNDYVTEPAIATVTTRDIIATLSKSRVRDTYGANDAEVRIGDIIEYALTVSVPEGTLGNLELVDTLPQGLKFEGTVSINGNPGPSPFAAVAPFTHSAVAEAGVSGDPVTGPSTVRWSIGSVTNQPNDGLSDDFVIVYRARVLNNAFSHDDLTIALNNAVEMSYDTATGTVTQSDSAAIIALQPRVTVSKSSDPVSGSVIAAGDAVTYTVDIHNAGTSPAYDSVLRDVIPQGMRAGGITMVRTYLLSGGPNPGLANLSPEYSPTTGVAVWNFAPGAYAIPAGDTLRIVYTVAADPALGAGLVLTNEAQVTTWYSFGIDDVPSLGAVTGVREIYGPTDTASTTLYTSTPPTKAIALPAGSTSVTIGEEVHYTITIPGTPLEADLMDVIVTDTLDPALVYLGASALLMEGGSSLGPLTLTDNTAAGSTDVSLAIDRIAAGRQAVITLRTRVDNSDVTNAGDAFVNRAFYRSNGVSALLATEPTEALTIVEPRITIQKGVEPIAPPTAGEVLTYTLTLNALSGDLFSDAFDVTVEDILGLGLHYVPGSARIGGIPAEPIVQGDGFTVPQTLVWNGFDLTRGSSLVVTYGARVLDEIGAGQELTNIATVRWTGLAGAMEGERTGSGEPAYNDYFASASTTLTTPRPGALLKENTRETAAVGEPFTYRITVPAVPHTTALYDVRIVDDLSASAADLRFVGVRKLAGSGDWTPENTGTGTFVVIVGSGGGIDIPAGEQIVLEVTVVLTDSAANVSGLQFANTASYTFNARNGDEATRAEGDGHTSPPMTVVGPDALILEKSGPVSMRLGTPATFTLEVHNPSSGTAWHPILVDRLPKEEFGGMCGAAPANVTALIRQPDGTGIALEEGAFTVRFAGEPACQWTLELLSGLDPEHRLIVRYDLQLDAGTSYGVELTNVAGAIRWFSADPEQDLEPRTYLRDLTDGTVGVLDHEDAHTVTTESPVLVFEKTVQNVTTGQTPGRNATPGDTLRYTLTATNVGTVELPAFSIVDELDRLNAEAAFAPGTLTLISVPTGADISGTSALGGTRGTGIVAIGNLALGAAGEANDSLTVVFEVTLAPVITSGTVVLNQGQIVYASPNTIYSDDPTINGPADPLVPGDEDPTPTLIASAPVIEIKKISQVMSGDTEVLMAGETLRYIITIRNLGNENASDVRLRDDIPTHTAYVPGSTTLNGVAVADSSPGISPLAAGMLVSTPDDPPGFLRADPTGEKGHIATVTFDVVVDPNAMDGLIIENQGFVKGDGAGSGPQPERPSDDPRTPVPNDPTRDIVGNLPLVRAQKTVAIHDDFGSPGIVDPGDVLRYTIVISNDSATPATGVILTDDVPANTTYIADSLRLNGAPVGTDAGVSPLIAGLAVHSPDEPGEGIISPRSSAVVTFDVRVDDGVPPGTLIINQGIVASNELPPEPTDADGLPSNGHQPTIIVVGEVQLLSITKEALVVGGGIAEAGKQIEYVIRVNNIGSIPAMHVVVTDDLSPPLGDQVSYVSGSGTLNGSTAGVSYANSTLVADFSSVYGDLPPGASAVVRFRVQIDPALPIGTTITNTGVVRWNDPAQSASASVSIDVGGTPGSGALTGSIWHDANLNRIHDGGDTLLEGWSVTLYRGNQLLNTTLTGADGGYRFGGIVPSDGTSFPPYEIHFRAPGAGPQTATLGYADSPFTDGPQRISDITVAAGSSLAGLNLPISPNGVVYDSVVRIPVAGARVALLNAATQTPLPERCFDDPAQQNQVTAQGGFYKFDLNFGDPSCRPGSAYLIEVTPPASGYVATLSQIIPAATGETAEPFSVPDCLGSDADAVPSSPEYCQVVTSAWPAPLSVAARSSGTVYHLHLTFSDGLVPGESQIFNNHLPVDPELDGAVAITKTSSLINVTKGQLVPYTITVNNVFGVPLYDISIVDRFPAGFKYVQGSARLDGQPSEPRTNGRELIWDDLELGINDRRTIQLLLVVGAGVTEGEYVNRAQVIHAATGGDVSGEATATVRVVPDPTFDCTDIVGKVFDDRNLNGVQDGAEKGLAGIRLVTARGLVATTDEHGRFHITCAVVPDEDRGSNFILKLDDRTLPTGFRVTTENPRVQRATRGKMMRFNFGATLHRVVGLDIADGVFEPDSTELRPQWAPRIDHLVEELKKDPAVLRLVYLADVEREGLVRERLKALKKNVAEQWASTGGGYRLTIETEVFWRRGGPP